MHSLLFAATALGALFTTVSSQSIDPNSVPLATRQQWCSSQVAACPLICLQTKGNSAGTNANNCDPSTLDFSCVCSNGVSPNASEYSQTVPYFECTQFNINCQSNCGGDNTCIANCVQNHPCGAQSPQRVNTSTMTTMTPTSATVTGSVKTTASDGVVYTGFGGSSATATASSSSKSGAARALAAGEAWGMGVIAAGLFAGFAMML